MRNVSGKIRKQRKDQLELLLASYERALVKAKANGNEESEKGLEILIKKAKRDIKSLG